MYVEFKDRKIPISNCISFKSRLLGMMFMRKQQEKIYRFPKCNSIHTFFMFQNIDVIMTDKDNNILYTYENLKPNKVIPPKKNVYYTYEFSHNHSLFIYMKLNNYIVTKNEID